MILFYLLLSLVSLCYGNNAALGFECPKTGGNTLTIEAVYSGTGTPSSVIWTYSGASLTIATSGCIVFGSVPAGFIDSSRLSYKCVTTDASLPVNTYQLIVSGLQDDVLGKTWAVTFTPPGAAAPPPVSLDAPSDCSGTTVPPTSSTTVPPTAPTTPPPTSSTTTKSPDIPVVIIVPCVVVVILIICIIVCILLRKKSNRKKKYRADSENVQMPQVDKNVTK